MQQKLKKKHGTKCNHNCNMSHIINSMPLYGESKSRQCFVKTTKCSIKYYLCQNLSVTENVSENANLKMNPQSFKLLSNIRNCYFHYVKNQRLKNMEYIKKYMTSEKKNCEKSQILLEIVICMLTSFRKKRLKCWL